MTPESYLPQEGKGTYSESVQVSLADPHGRNFLSIRLCQYPEEGVAWIWAALYLDGKLWKYQNNSVRWSGSASVKPEEQHAEYTATVGSTHIHYTRDGTNKAPERGKMVFSSEEGESISIEVEFSPAGQFVGLIPGRTEMFGAASATVLAGGKDASFSGPGQWHEQQQTDPRFTTPFVYASLWGDGTYSTLLQTPKGSGGYLIRDGGVDVFSDATFGAPADVRDVHLVGRDGPGAAFQLKEVKPYYLEIYGKRWRGAFVKADFLGAPVCGFANTWKI